MVQHPSWSEPLRNLAQSLTCVTIFPDRLPLLEKTGRTRELNLAPGTVSHLYRLAVCMGQLQYGAQCEACCNKLAEGLKNGNINSFSMLWEAARQSIVQIRQNRGEKRLSGFQTRRQGTSADDLDTLCYTPWDAPYVHLATDVAQAAINNTPPFSLPRSQSAPPLQIGNLRFRLDPLDENNCQLKHGLWGQPDASLNQPPIPLSQLFLCFEKTLLESPRNRPGLAKELADSVKDQSVGQFIANYPDHLLELPKINHTAAVYLDACEQQLNHLFALAIQEPDRSDAGLGLLARIYWWSANAMFDARGSAAKTELLFRALCKAKGFDLPPWKAGVSADLLCMKMDENQWVSEFRDHLAICL